MYVVYVYHIRVHSLWIGAWFRGSGAGKQERKTMRQVDFSAPQTLGLGRADWLEFLSYHNVQREVCSCCPSWGLMWVSDWTECDGAGWGDGNERSGGVRQKVLHQIMPWRCKITRAPSMLLSNMCCMASCARHTKAYLEDREIQNQKHLALSEESWAPNPKEEQRPSWQREAGQRYEHRTWS